MNTPSLCQIHDLFTTRQKFPLIVWRPLTPAERTSNDGDFSIVARLRSDSTAARATIEIATMAQALSKGARTAWADDLQRTDVLHVRASLQALFAAAMLTLIVACANVAALMGTRVADRASEMALRGALGATRGRLFAQLIVESLTLALAGGALGMLVGHSTLRVLVAMAPVSVPRLTEISLDAPVSVGPAMAFLLHGVSPTDVPTSDHRVLATRRKPTYS